MRSSADRDLVARDTSIPNLGDLLDADVMLALLQAHWPDAGIDRAEPFYLRYKPGTSCLAGYRVGFAAGETLLAMTARRRDSIDKIRNHLSRSGVRGALSDGRTMFGETVTVSEFPNDARLPALARIAAEPAIPEIGLGQGDAHSLLRYRPERRCVFQVTSASGPSVLKCYRQSDYPGALATTSAFRSMDRLQVPKLNAHAHRYQSIVTSWIEGRPASAETTFAPKVGEALALLHRQSGTALRTLSVARSVQGLLDLAHHIGHLWPPLGSRAERIALSIAHTIQDGPCTRSPIHGDFHIDQIIDCGDQVGIVDFDEAGMGDPAWDLGNIAGHLAVDGLRNGESEGSDFAGALVDAYRHAGRKVTTAQVRVQTAHSIFRLASRPFRERASDWPERIEQVLSLAETMVAPPATTGLSRPLCDPTMPQLESALEPSTMARILSLDGASIASATVVKHKRARRCVVRYTLTSPTGERPALLAKVRSKGADTRAFALQQELWATTFGPDCTDNIRVAEPIALVPSLSMWVQREVRGLPFGFGEGRVLVDPRRTALAIAKLHSSAVRPARRHRLEDELQILDDRLAALGLRRPALAPRLDALGDIARVAAERGSPARLRPIHRDFYFDHLLVDRTSLALIDLDLLSLGDPALDVGNFVAHLTELSLREHGHPDRFGDWSRSFKHHYRQASASPCANIDLYEWLSLVRLIEIADRMPERRHSVERLLDHVETIVRSLLADHGRVHDA